LISVVLFFYQTQCSTEHDYGRRLSDHWHWLFRGLHRFDSTRVSENPVMTVMYVICGILALLLLIYLFVAMLKPEWF
jgi:K+-transporting ATPase KdpF subunit